MSDYTPPQQPNPAPAEPPYAGAAPPAPPVAPPYATAPQQGYAQQGYAPAAYPPPAYGYGGYQQLKTNTLAVVSLIASIVGFVWILPIIGSLTGIITGHIAVGQIKRTGEKGRGMALAGLIVGYVGLAFVIIGLIFLVAFIGWAVEQDTSSTYSSSF